LPFSLFLGNLKSLERNKQEKKMNGGTGFASQKRRTRKQRRGGRVGCAHQKKEKISLLSFRKKKVRQRKPMPAPHRAAG